MKDHTVWLRDPVFWLLLVVASLTFTSVSNQIRDDQLRDRVTVLEATNATQTATITAEADAITRMCKQIEGCVNQ